MKKSKAIIASMFTVSAIFQAIYFSGGYRYMFAVGLNPENRSFSVAEYMIYMLIPILFTVFFVSGTYNGLTHGYGKLKIIRNYSKTRLILKQIAKILADIFLFTSIQFIIYTILIDKFEKTTANIPLTLLMYFLTVLLISLIQCLLELYISPQTANIIIFVFIFLSCYLIQILPDYPYSPILRIILFPCLMFASKNGLIEHSGFMLYLLFLILYNAVVILLSISKFKKCDIF